jgi:hypothetical protein
MALLGRCDRETRRPSQIAAGTSLTKHGEPAVELLHLRVHPIGCFEISFGIGDKRSMVG